MLVSSSLCLPAEGLSEEDVVMRDGTSHWELQGRSPGKQSTVAVVRGAWFGLLVRTTTTSPSNWMPFNSSCIHSLTCSALPPPDPAPMSGRAIDRYPRLLASVMALRTDSLTDHSDDCHNKLMPATWIMALNGSLPAPVSTAPPRGIMLHRQTLNGCPVSLAAHGRAALPPHHADCPVGPLGSTPIRSERLVIRAMDRDAHTV